MTQPAVSPAAQRAYDQLPDRWRSRDEAGGWLLLALVAGFVSPLEQAWAILEDPGPREFFDLDTVPADWFEFLAERNGARLAASMTEDQGRAELKNPTGWRRGLPASMIEAAQHYLPDGAVYLLRERTDPDMPGDKRAHITLNVHEAGIDPDDLDDLAAAFDATVTIGMYGHLVVCGQWWAEESARHATHALAAAAHPTHASQATGS